MKPLVFAGVALITMALAWWTDPFTLSLVVLTLFLWIGIPVTLIAGVAWLISASRGRSSRASLIALKAVGLFVLFAVSVVPLNRWAQNWATDDAKAFPGRIAPMLEAYKKEHGVYPATLEIIPDKPPVPRLLKRFKQQGYSSKGNSYSFTFPQPGGLIDVWVYDSITGTWHFSS